jgi:ribosome-binding protein aMBF1 (putative translation factor)
MREGMSIGDKIRAARVHRGWSVVDLAEKLGVTRQCVESWEAGKTAPRAQRVTKVARVLDLEPAALLP